MSKQIVIPASDWMQHIVDAIGQFEPGDEIIVDTEAKKILAERAAARMGKAVEVVVVTADGR